MKNSPIFLQQSFAALKALWSLSAKNRCKNLGYCNWLVWKF